MMTQLKKLLNKLIYNFTYTNQQLKVLQDLYNIAVKNIQLYGLLRCKNNLKYYDYRPHTHTIILGVR